MTALFLVITLCVTGTDTCETHDIPFAGNELTCATQAQAIIAKHHRPGLTVARFGCERK